MLPAEVIRTKRDGAGLSAAPQGLAEGYFAVIVIGSVAVRVAPAELRAINCSA